ncbi:uncharacterized protein LOC144711291 isoform X2 [Wolffia australiana]
MELVYSVCLSRLILGGGKIEREARIGGRREEWKNRRRMTVARFATIVLRSLVSPIAATGSALIAGECILRVWQHGFALQPCKCPICRRSITLLIPSQTLRYQSHEPGAAQILDQVQRYNRLFGNAPSGFIQRIQDVPFFLQRLARELMEPSRSIPAMIRMRIIVELVLSMLYILSPIDIIPEGVLGIIGIVDDMFILFIAFLHLSALYRSVLISRHSGN